jgi:addiction module RelE/StbE family toxin
MPVEWSEQALEDVEEIRTFIARDSLRYAELVVDRIFEAVERLETYPLSGRIVPEFRDPALREAIIGNYRIVYRTGQGSISIATVSHTSRLLGPNT